jgi:hypothetical protein
MATNTSAPFGFAQRSGTGSAPTYEQVEALVAYNTDAIFFGDPVGRLSDGTVAGDTTDSSLPGTQPIAGIFIGCHYLSVANKRTIWSNYWPGSDVASGNNVTAYLVNDPNAQFVAQVGGSTTVGLVQANIGSNVQFAYGTGTAANGISGAYIDISVTPAVTATLPFRVVNLLTTPPGSPGTAAGEYNYAIVAFNNVETKSLTAPF